MSTTSQTAIKAPYLITSRKFPPNFEELEPELSKMYIEVARAVNIRTNGIFDQFQIVTGERWFTDFLPAPTTSSSSNEKRQSYRQVYPWTGTAPPTIPHNITGIVEFTRIYGTCVTNAAGTAGYRPIPYASIIALTDQISVQVDNTNINISVGATVPTITSGIIVLEYLLN
jgi:hypothetical protein